MERSTTVLFCFALHSAMFHHLSAETKCVAIVSPDIDACKQHGHLTVRPRPCVNNTVCRKTFNVTVVDIKPHSSIIIPDMIRHVLDMCCGMCTKVTVIKNLTDVSHMNLSLMTYSHMVYPVLGYTDHTHMHGFSFIPMIDETQSFFIRRQKTNKEIVIRLINSAADLWPLLIVCLVMAFIAGFPVWLIETWRNKSEFPRPFIEGLFEGFWWSFVSMTTVGYGDRAPKCLLSRLLAILWILVGITLCSLFTASLTNEITSAYTDSNSALTSMKVGILKGRIYDASVVTKGGGYVVVTKEEGFIPGVLELINKLRKDEVSGFVLDKYTYIHLLQEMNKMSADASSSHRAKANFFIKGTHVQEIKSGGKNLGYGMLVKYDEDYNYFKHFISDNRPIIQTCKELKLHSIEPAHHDENATHDIFNPNTGLFVQALTLGFVVIGGIFLLGLFYEIGRWKMRQQTKSMCSCLKDFK